MLPEVEAYYGALRADTRELWEAERQAQRENPVPAWRNDMTAEERQAYYDAEAAREVAITRVRQARRERQYAALDGLRNSEDPMVRWIVTTEAWDEYPGHVEDFLKALPMAREEIEEFGEGKGWCHVYDDFLDEARDAGVLPKEDPNVISVDGLVTDLSDHFGYDPEDRASVRRMIRNRLPEMLRQAKEIEARNA